MALSGRVLDNFMSRFLDMQYFCHPVSLSTFLYSILQKTDFDISLCLLFFLRCSHLRRGFFVISLEFPAEIADIFVSNGLCDASNVKV